LITSINVSGADGLVKLWTVKSNECVATYDHHEDKVLIDPMLYSFFCGFSSGSDWLRDYFRPLCSFFFFGAWGGIMEQNPSKVLRTYNIFLLIRVNLWKNVV
jgi:hypothetical protein